MAAIGLRSAFWATALLFAGACFLRADTEADVHAVIGEVANALTAGDASVAMDSFSKSCPERERIQEEFGALTNAYSIHNAVGFNDESIARNSASLTLQWDMTLTPLQGTFSTNRSAILVFKLKLEGKRWKITSVSDVNFFAPDVSR